MLLVELLHSTNPAVLLAAAQALLDLAKVRSKHYLYRGTITCELGEQALLDLAKVRMG